MKERKHYFDVYTTTVGGTIHNNDAVDVFNPKIMASCFKLNFEYNNNVQYLFTKADTSFVNYEH